MKKKQKQTAQILSPENYIRQRARNLPIYKCFINEGWDEEGSMVHATLARKHVNGNITFCSYLVDLQCLGIKDTLYRFNEPEYEFDAFRDQLDANLGIEEIDYNLLHNIVHAGWEYAEDIGFEPHKEFLSITQYMLEEDNDDIPLIEIKCGGENGKPLFVQGPFEDDVMANIILKRLEKNVGIGNFDYVLGSDHPMDGEADDWDEDDEDDSDDWDEDDEDDSDDDDYEKYLDGLRDEYSVNSHGDNVEIFLELTRHLDEGDFDEENPPEEDDQESEENFDRIVVLTDILYGDLVDFKDVERWMTKWRKESYEYTITNAGYHQMLGLPDDEEIGYEDLSYLTREEDEVKLQKYVREKWGELPYAIYLDLNELDDPEEQKDKLSKALSQYPDHALLRLEEKALKIQDKKLKKTDLSFHSSFGDRKEITPLEYVRWQSLLLFYFLSNNDLAGIESLELFNEPGINSGHSQINLFISVLHATRISLLRVFLLQ